jgi:hypothetical protein
MGNSSVHPSLNIFVVSHDVDLLEAVPPKQFLQKVLLQELDIPKRYQGENLAESRFLIGDRFIQGDYDFRGFISARWDERFPDWPKLAELDTLIGDETMRKHHEMFFAPISLKLSKSQVDSWIDIQDLLHPGMKALIEQLISFHGMRFERHNTYNLVMGNNFILSSESAKDFLAFWHKSLDFLENAYGLDFPFIFRCHKCGETSPDGIDRWTKVRHAGFLLERVTALFFLSRQDLKSFYWHKGRILELKRKRIYRGIGIGFRLNIMLEKVAVFGRSCKGSHQQTEMESPK